MQSFSPYEPLIIGAYLATFIIIYILGMLVVPKNGPLNDTAGRMALGFLLFACMLGMAHAGIGSMLIVFLPFFLFVARKRAKQSGGMLKIEFSKSHAVQLGLVMFLGLAVFFHEAVRYDMRIDEQSIYVGNTDISFYSAHGQMMYQFGEETLASSVSENPQKILYHYVDLWVAGFFSNYLDITPYYAYAIVYRSLGITITLLVFFALFQSLVGIAIAAIGALLVLFLNNAFVVLVPSSGLDLLSAFSSNWPVYAESSYLVCGVGIGLFWLLIRNGMTFSALVGLMLFGAMHSSFVVPGFLMAGLILAMRLLTPSLLQHLGLETNWKQPLILFVAGVLPYVYVTIDGRGFPLHLEDFGKLAYLSVHTFVRVGWTLVLSAPLWVGALYMVLKKKPVESRFIFLYGLVGVAGFGLLFAIFQSSNATKLFTAISTTILFPLGLWGLLHMTKSESSRLRTTSYALLALIVVTTLWSGLGSHQYRLVYNWESIDGYKESHTYSAEELNAMNELAGHKGAFAICEEGRYNRKLIRYNEFLPLSSLFPRTFVFRMNQVAEDLGGNIEGRAWVDKTAVFQYRNKSASPEWALQEYLDWLRPDYIITDNKEAFCSPIDLDLITTGKTIDFKQYRFHEVND